VQHSKSTLPSESVATRSNTLGTTTAFAATRSKTLGIKRGNVANTGAFSGLDNRAGSVVVPTVEKGIRRMEAKKKLKKRHAWQN
jgi:hypothetical protein